MPPKTDTNAKMDQILEQLKQLDQIAPLCQKMDNLLSTMGSFKEELGALTFTVQGHEDRLEALERDMVSQKESSNNQQQQLRSLTIRLLNVPYAVGESSNNSAQLRETVFHRFFVPLLTAAVENKEIYDIPHPNTVIDSCFRPYMAKEDEQPPPVIIKLANKPIKIALMKNRKELPKPTSIENTKGITRFILVEDLTPDNHRCLAALSKSKLTAKVWSVDGRIKYTLATKPEVVLTVKSVYDPISKLLNA